MGEITPPSPGRLPTAGQIRAARALLDWSLVDLANAANVSVSTVKRLEVEGFQASGDGKQQSVCAALERAGVRFFDDDGYGLGLSVRSP